MAEAADYSARDHLRDGRPVKIRALRPDDRADMLAAIGRTSMQSLQRRFFVPKKGFSEREIAFFLDIDFESHVALVAQVDKKMDIRSSRAADDLSSSSQATQRSPSSWSMTIRVRALERS